MVHAWICEALCWPFSILFFNLPVVLFPDKPHHTRAPFGFKITECALAPVAMEDSDHEHSSSSDEQDSCPASPNQSRHHDHDHHEQVPVTPPQIYIYFSVTAHLQLISAVKVCSFYALKLRIRHEFISLGSNLNLKLCHSVCSQLNLSGRVACWIPLHYLSIRETLVTVTRVHSCVSSYRKFTLLKIALIMKSKIPDV